MIQLLDTKKQLLPIRIEIDQAIADVLDSGNYVLGPHVEQFEDAFAQQHGSRYAVGCNTGTSALHLILLALDIGPGDEVITVSMTFAATVAAICYTGATPVLVDIDSETWTMDPLELESAITPRTRAIVPVHLHGRVADMKQICEIANRAGIPVVEDAAQAHLASLGTTKVGSFGIAGAFSFYPGKNLGACGEGGAVTTNDAQIADSIRLLRNWGARDKYNQERLAYNYRMDAIQGAILGVKLRHLEAWTERRREVARRYESLREIASIQLPGSLSEVSSHVFHIYSLLVPDQKAAAAYLFEAGVGTGFHYPIPVHKQPAYSALVVNHGNLTVTNRFASRCLSIPLHPDLTEIDLSYIIEVIGNRYANS